jgi:hypothetical protein
MKYGRVLIYSLQQTNGAPLRFGLRHIADGLVESEF